MNSVRVGIIGVGGTGRYHAKYLAAGEHAGRMFALMFQQRTVPMHRKLNELLEGGQIGEPNKMK